MGSGALASHQGKGPHGRSTVASMPGPFNGRPSKQPPRPEAGHEPRCASFMAGLFCSGVTMCTNGVTDGTRADGDK